MPSEEQTASLQQYGIGPKIRALRLKKKLSLAQLGGHTGLSAGLLSKIERNLVFPRLATLLKIALVFHVGLEHFFVEFMKDPRIALVRKKDRISLPDCSGKESPSYFFESLVFPATDRKIEAYYAKFESNAKPAEAHSHAGVEVIYVLSGQLVVNIRGEDMNLRSGDSIYFDCTYAHSYRPKGRGFCSAIVVVTR